MDERRTCAVGITGLAVGNLLLAASNAVLGSNPVLVGSQLVATLGLGTLATVWWNGSDEFEFRGPVRQYLPTLLLVSGALLVLTGLLMLLVALL